HLALGGFREGEHLGLERLDGRIAALDAVADLAEGVLDVSRALGVGEVAVELVVVERAAEPGAAPEESGNDDRPDGGEHEEEAELLLPALAHPVTPAGV